MSIPPPPCQCGDNDCADTFGAATQNQDRTACCRYCGWFDCDVCGWTDPSGATFTDYLNSLDGGIR